MAGGGVVIGLAVSDGKRGFILAGQILIDIAAQEHIDLLDAATDAQNRFSGLKDLVKQLLFHIVPGS